MRSEASLWTCLVQLGCMSIHAPGNATGNTYRTPLAYGILPLTMTWLTELARIYVLPALQVSLTGLQLPPYSTKHAQGQPTIPDPCVTFAAACLTVARRGSSLISQSSNVFELPSCPCYFWALKMSRKLCIALCYCLCIAAECYF